jgi:hypothetical protein
VVEGGATSTAVDVVCGGDVGVLHAVTSMAPAKRGTRDRNWLICEDSLAVAAA